MKIKPKKSLGQNFLSDKNIIKAIVEVGNIKDNNLVLEIGPGTGNLTEFILKKNPKIFFVIEKDYNLVKLLYKKFNNKINIINKDVLNFELNDISNEKVIVYGNLPYNISTEILIKWITDNKKFQSCKKLILMFQKEVADRIMAKTNSKNYGRLSIISNWRMNIKKEFDISPNCFFPKPKVNSTLLSFEPKKKYFNIKKPYNLEKITKVFFNQRRKMIKNPLKQIFKKPDMILEKLKLDINLRPQNLSPLNYFEITKEYEDLIS
ncbi:MAG TPA: 16S rRNA (adenine(1518)-N(6)/adenine(1519)-N(6))-dimethyltransferase RsmA [Candidatus Pelagibacter bacterium]|jgi:16S rRNA (adenine1518-N6/adenine1519-N6)-dimethyltransferase|nr:ribosomal RNA small subunit methyltransferase A [Pelagibacteraceae bacterium]HJN84152.1 16S rRNA (adenine(1518)-N(6)/adenine(1519)-N(6))-dimethyltransferase RsmA [Candidatus Pelagibacter bacterium]|tara:strand:- start:4353 stop:5144 length:792 start_codon:yes stop_codon:yes gene_type:complete